METTWEVVCRPLRAGFGPKTISPGPIITKRVSAGVARSINGGHRPQGKSTGNAGRGPFTHGDFLGAVSVDGLFD